LEPVEFAGAQEGANPKVGFGFELPRVLGVSENPFPQSVTPCSGGVPRARVGDVPEPWDVGGVSST